MNYYVYAYLREDNSPYYIGMGKDYRMDTPHNSQNIALPPKHLRVKLHEGLTEAQALDIEEQLIAEYGRKIDGGQLLNIAVRGDGSHRTPEIVSKAVETRRRNGSYTTTPEQNESRRRKMKEHWARIKAQGKSHCSEEGIQKLRECGKNTKKRYTDGLTPQQRYTLRKKGLYPHK